MSPLTQGLNYRSACDHCHGFRCIGYCAACRLRQKPPTIQSSLQVQNCPLTYNSMSTNQPPYLRSLLRKMYPTLRCLHSASQNLLSIPFSTTNFGKRSFSFSTPTIWNELPAAIRESNTLDIFNPCPSNGFLRRLPARGVKYNQAYLEF